MFDLLYPMALILSGWAVFFAICYGLGRAVWKVTRIEFSHEFLAILFFWVGWGVLIIFLQLWHLIFKVDIWAFAILAIAAGISLLRDRRSLLRDLLHLVRHRPILCLAIALASVSLANQALRPLYDYDTGLYHLQALRWTQDYPIVIGLANLHGRFGFNNANFLYVALVGVGPWRGIELNVANSLLLMVATVQALIGLECAIRERRNWKLPHLFAALTIIPILDYTLLRGATSSPSSDAASGMLHLTLMTLFLAFLQRKDFSGSQALFELALIVFLAVLGVVIKLSSGIFSVGVVFFCVSLWLAHNRHDAKRALRVIAGLGLVGGSVLVPWMFRGILLSGYPLYPSTLGAVPVSWRVPASSAESEARWIYSWARLPQHSPDEVLGSWAWLEPWLERQREISTVYLPALLAVAAILLVIFRFVSDRKALARPGLAWMFLIPLTAALVAWFLSAPNARFAVSLLYGTAIGGFLLALSSFSRARVSLAVALLVALLLGWHVLEKASPYLVRAGPNRGFYPVSSVELETYETNSGLTLYRPATGDRCFDAPRPCTPYPKPTLRLRGDSIRSGFEVGAAE